MRFSALLGAIPLALAIAACGGSSEPTVTLKIPSSAMEPTLHCGRESGIANGCESAQDDRVIVARTNGELRRGEILVFQTPPRAAVECGAGGLFVKRLIGLPGERVRERNGWFFVNGQKVDDSSYVRPGRRDDRTGYWIVPKDSYFFVGDNRTQSCDSRRWGAVPRANIRGLVIAVLRGQERIELR